MHKSAQRENVIELVKKRIEVRTDYVSAYATTCTARVPLSYYTTVAEKSHWKVAFIKKDLH